MGGIHREEGDSKITIDSHGELMAAEYHFALTDLKCCCGFRSKNGWDGLRDHIDASYINSNPGEQTEMDFRNV